MFVCVYVIGVRDTTPDAHVRTRDHTGTMAGGFVWECAVGTYLSEQTLGTAKGSPGSKKWQQQQQQQHDQPAIPGD